MQDQLSRNLHGLLEEPLSDEELRVITGQGHRNISPTSTSWFRCAWCDILLVLPVGTKKNQGMKQCGKCQSAVYCSALCLDQDKNIGGHRRTCAEICSTEKAVSELGLEYSQSNGIMDVFDRVNGMVFHFGDPGRGLGTVGEDYLRTRTALVHSLLEEGVRSMLAVDTSVTKLFAHIPPPHWNYLALELAMENAIDVLHLDPSVKGSSTKAGVAHSLLVLERYQDLYDYVKYWNMLPLKLRQIYRRQEEVLPPELGEVLGPALGPIAFMNTKRQSLFEDQSQFALRLPSRPSQWSSEVTRTFPGPSRTEVVCVLYVALGKLRVYQGAANVRIVVDNCLPIESMVAINIGSYLGISPEWMTTDPKTIVNQCHELLTFANSSIPGILDALIQSPSLPSDATTRYSPGTFPIMELLKTTWFSYNLPWTFLLDHVENAEKCVCRIPRNDLVQQVLDRVYHFYIETQMSDPDYQRCRQHWERVKDSYCVRRFLNEEVENGGQLRELGFCGSRIFWQLERQDLHTPANLELLLGNPNVPDSTIGVEYALTCEHLEQVKYFPEVQSFFNTHNVDVPNDDGDLFDLIAKIRHLLERNWETEIIQGVFGDSIRFTLCVLG